MPGGPLPKPADQRARTNKGRSTTIHAKEQTFTIKPSAQPPLPRGVDWHPQTRQWWKNLGDFPVLEDATKQEWDYLIDTAVIHSMFWNGDKKLAAELRMRMAKIGVTPEDRARLRITFATADQVEGKAKPKAAAKPKFTGLRAVGDE